MSFARCQNSNVPLALHVVFRGEQVIAMGTPMARLEEVLVPVYFHHRYQLGAAVKVIGGLEYTYAMRGDGQQPTSMLPPAWQLRALEVVLSALEPGALDLSEAVLELIPPRPRGHGKHRELFGSRTDPVLDPLGAAATAALVCGRTKAPPGTCAASMISGGNVDPDQIRSLFGV